MAEMEDGIHAIGWEDWGDRSLNLLLVIWLTAGVDAVNLSRSRKPRVLSKID